MLPAAPAGRGRLPLRDRRDRSLPRGAGQHLPLRDGLGRWASGRGALPADHPAPDASADRRLRLASLVRRPARGRPRGAGLRVRDPQAAPRRPPLRRHRRDARQPGAPRPRRRPAQRDRGPGGGPRGPPARRALLPRPEHGGHRHVRGAGGAAPPGAGAAQVQALGEDRHRGLLRGAGGGPGRHLPGPLQRAGPDRLPARAQPVECRRLAGPASGGLHRRRRHPSLRRGVRCTACWSRRRGRRAVTSPPPR